MPASLPFIPERGELKPAIGRKCCTVCICAGLNKRVLLSRKLTVRKQKEGLNPPLAGSKGITLMVT
jgi:hypothetical protein